MLRPQRFCLAATLCALSPLLAQEPSIRLVDDLDFGILLADARGGMIALTELGTLIPTGPGIQPRSGAPAHAARLLLQGKPGTAFTLSLDPPTPFLAGPRSGRIPMDTYLSLPATLKGIFSSEGTAEFRLGGRLDLRAELPPGAYLAPVRLQLMALGSKGPTSIWQTFQVKVRLQSTFNLTCLQGLDFGSLLPGSNPGTFEVNAEGGYQPGAAGGPTLVKGSPHPALFLLEGQPGSEYSIQMPQQVMLTGPGRAIAVGSFRLSMPLQGALVQDAKRFGLGARILIPPDQENGSYHGVLHVTVAYP